MNRCLYVEELCTEYFEELGFLNQFEDLQLSLLISLDVVARCYWPQVRHRVHSDY